MYGRRMLSIGAILTLLVGVMIAPVDADQSTVPPPGIRENTPSVYALTNARIVTAPGQVIDKGTIVIRDGSIVAVGAQVTAPSDARIYDMSGKTVYPGLIDAYSELPSAERGRGGRGGRGSSGDNDEAESSSGGGADYWNSDVTPQMRVDQKYEPSDKTNEKYRSQGITARLVAPNSGIIKGTSVLVSTGDDDATHAILKDRVALHGALTTRRGWGDRGYPNSPMGAMSLFRQAFYDADWYRRAWDAYRREPTLARPEHNDALAAMHSYAIGEGTVIIDASDEMYFLRADQVAKELGLDIIVRGSGKEYRRLNAIAQTGHPVIVPVNFPKTPDVKTPEKAMTVSLEELMEWDIAPENPGRLAKSGVPFALSTDGLKETGDFLKQVREAVKRGLPADAALRAMTVTPATWYGVRNRLGTIESGKLAHLVVTDGDLFDDKTEIVETWVNGTRYEEKSDPLVDARGEWTLNLSETHGVTDQITLSLKGEPKKLKGELVVDTNKIKLDDVTLNDARVAFAFKGDTLGWDGTIRMSATVIGNDLSGDGVWSDEEKFTFTGTRSKPHSEEPDTSKAKDKKSEEPTMASYDVNYPLGAIGVSSIPPPQAGDVYLTDATVWTCGPQGKLDGATVLVRNGKIAAVGDVSIPPGATTINLAGKHVTPGIIDCHSHSATNGGINESGQTVTAEVRIGDFVDCNDMDIYRQLAGGVTAANVLHGSANTIGGQNQVIKFRWGGLPEEIKFEGAPKGIKFALGENVKQSNWGDDFRSRYPQTRMGVEQLVRDEFAAAREYKQRWTDWQRSKKGIPPRRDLELDAIAEILDGERLIHCHSYRQDEILALMRTCEDFGVTIGTFQHILEGYKVADVMANHGAGGSSFSDWWAYKIEVYDAIPYNGALMHNAGVVTTFNSDSGELARRLNTEAAKAVKYGGVPEEEALKFVTLNAAIQLHIDDRVGSLEAGKDADFAVWNTSPLSTLAVCEQTWIDGRKYFDRNDDLNKRRPKVQEMRATLIQKALNGDGEESGGKGGRFAYGQMWPRHDIFCGCADHGHGDEFDWKHYSDGAEGR